MGVPRECVHVCIGQDIADDTHNCIHVCVCVLRNPPSHPGRTPQLDQALKAGDLLRLFHVEQEAFLISRIDDDDIRDNDKLELSEERNEMLETIYERLFHDVDKTISNPDLMFIGLRRTKMRSKARSKHSIKSIWEVENEQVTLGAPIAFKQPFRLRHFATGAYLCLRKPRSKKDKKGAMLPDGTGGAVATIIPKLRTEEDVADTLFFFEYVSSQTSSGAAGSSSGDSSQVEDFSKDLYCSRTSMTRLFHVSSEQYVTANLVSDAVRVDAPPPPALYDMYR